MNFGLGNSTLKAIEMQTKIMTSRTIETKVKILKYKYDFDMLRIISIILIPNIYLTFNENRKE